MSIEQSWKFEFVTFAWLTSSAITQSCTLHIKRFPSARPVTFPSHSLLKLSSVKHQTFQNECRHCTDRLFIFSTTAKSQLAGIVFDEFCKGVRNTWCVCWPHVRLDLFWNAIDEILMGIVFARPINLVEIGVCWSGKNDETGVRINELGWSCDD